MIAIYPMKVDRVQDQWSRIVIIIIMYMELFNPNGACLGFRWKCTLADEMYTSSSATTISLSLHCTLPCTESVIRLELKCIFLTCGTMQKRIRGIQVQGVHFLRGEKPRGTLRLCGRWTRIALVHGTIQFGQSFKCQIVHNNIVNFQKSSLTKHNWWMVNCRYYLEQSSQLHYFMRAFPWSVTESYQRKSSTEFWSTGHTFQHVVSFFLRIHRSKWTGQTTNAKIEREVCLAVAATDPIFQLQLPFVRILPRHPMIRFHCTVFHWECAWGRRRKRSHLPPPPWQTS